jgi:DNA polymerase
MNAALEKLNLGIKKCKKCPLCKSRLNAVPGEGPENPKIFFLGEAPGSNEDKTGKPFCGKSGKYLDELFADIGVSRQEVFITSSVKCRPPKNRKPIPIELKICKLNWLDKQLVIFKPKLIVTLGKTALFQLTGRTDNLMQVHGKMFTYNGSKCLITFHPASAMRFPKIDVLMKSDFQKLKLLLKKF